MVRAHGPKIAADNADQWLAFCKFAMNFVSIVLFQPKIGCFCASDTHSVCHRVAILNMMLPLNVHGYREKGI
jgi:hypothetical protein